MNQSEFQTIEKAEAFLNAEIAIRSWSDPKFESDFNSDRTSAINQLCDEFNIPYEIAAKMNISIPESPVGDMPYGNSTSVIYAGTQVSDGCGAYNTVTAECLCPNSFTGGCSCFSVYGTPCTSCYV